MLLFSSNSPFSPQLMHHHLLYTSLWGGPVAFFRRRPRGEIIGKWWAQYGCLSSNVRIRRLPQVKPYHWPLQSHMNHQQQRDTHRHTHTHFQGRISSGIFLPSHVYSKLRSFLFLFFSFFSEWRGMLKTFQAAVWTLCLRELCDVRKQRGERGEGSLVSFSRVSASTLSVNPGHFKAATYSVLLNESALWLRA